MEERIVKLLYANVSWSESKSNEVISLALAPTRDVKTGSYSCNQQAKVIKWFEMKRSAWSHSEQLQTAIINVFRTVLFVNWQRLTWAKSKDNESKKNAASEKDLSRIITSQTYKVIEVLKKVLSWTHNDWVEQGGITQQWEALNRGTLTCSNSHFISPRILIQ